MSSLELRGICKSFRRSDSPAVSSADLSVGDGELVAILGPSGCGKTTLLRMISGFLSLDEGSILVGDLDITKTPPHRRDIGMVYQDYALWPHMTAFENVSFGLEMRKIRQRERETRIKEALELVGLSEFEGRYPRQLSGGQQQRVALARALVIRPHLLLLDEPFASLDANLRVQLRYYVRDLQRRLGVTTIFVTHDQEEALAVSDRLVLMRDGVIIEVAPGEVMYRTPNSVFGMTFMGEANLLDGEVHGINGKKVVVATALGKLQCLKPKLGQCELGDRVRIGIRPDDILLEVDRKEESAGYLLGSVVNRIFLGPWARYEVELGDVKLHIRIPSSLDHQDLSPGTTVVVEIREGGARILSEV